MSWWGSVFSPFLRLSFNSIVFFLDVLTTVLYRGRGRTVPPICNSILRIPATQLAADIRSGKLSSETVVKAYIERIKEVEPFINAVAEERFDAALLDARKADSLVRSNHFTRQQLETDKPLLGVPLTVKCHLMVEGMPYTAGSVRFKDLVSEEDAPAVASLKEAGAIVLATSNMPELGADLETNNRLYGRTNNPYNTNRSVGGTSGGEGALVGAGASILGIGTDLAGSVRIPALFCGVFAHKPTRGLVANKTDLPRVDFVKDRYFEVGPICRYAQDLVVAMKVLSLKKDLKLDRKVNFRNVKIYFWKSMYTFFPVGVEMGMDEALMKALEHFRSTYGSHASEFEMPHARHLTSIITNEFFPDVGDDPRVVLSHPKRDATDVHIFLEMLKALFGRSDFTFPLLAIMGLGYLPRSVWYRERDVPRYRAMDRDIRETFDALLDDNSVLLCPTLPLSAPYHKAKVKAMASFRYTCVFNYLGLPATHCTLGLDAKGMPVGVQVVAGKHNDSMAIACAVELEKAFGGWVAPGGILETDMK